jgi:hypothetical protein
MTPAQHTAAVQQVYDRIEVAMAAGRYLEVERLYAEVTALGPHPATTEAPAYEAPTHRPVRNHTQEESLF